MASHQFCSFYAILSVNVFCERRRSSAAAVTRLRSESLVRHGKGALLQWEEDIPPGSCCSNRKQPERSLLVTAVVEASGAKRSRNGDQARTQVEI